MHKPIDASGEIFQEKSTLPGEGEPALSHEHGVNIAHIQAVTAHAIQEDSAAGCSIHEAGADDIRHFEIAIAVDIGIDGSIRNCGGTVDIQNISIVTAAVHGEAAGFNEHAAILSTEGDTGIGQVDAAPVHPEDGIAPRACDGGGLRLEGCIQRALHNERAAVGVKQGALLQGKNLTRGDTNLTGIGIQGITQGESLRGGQRGGADCLARYDDVGLRRGGKIAHVGEEGFSAAGEVIEVQTILISESEPLISYGDRLVIAHEHECTAHAIERGFGASFCRNKTGTGAIRHAETAVVDDVCRKACTVNLDLADGFQKPCFKRASVHLQRTILIHPDPGVISTETESDIFQPEVCRYLEGSTGDADGRLAEGFDGNVRRDAPITVQSKAPTGERLIQQDMSPEVAREPGSLLNGSFQGAGAITIS